MKTLNDFLLLCVANNRTRYYISALKDAGYLPGHILFLTDPNNKPTPGQRQSDLAENFLAYLKETGVAVSVVHSVDINAPEVIAFLKTRPEAHVIYSGPGGGILKKEILSLGKKFLHVHPGSLPDFRGSTTIYYQILAKQTCGVSAIFLAETIDAGPLLKTAEYPFPDQPIDMDYDYDPQVRSRLLASVVDDYAKNGVFPLKTQNPDDGETYFIMHPVLRHIARLKIEAHQQNVSATATNRSVTTKCS